MRRANTCYLNRTHVRLNTFISQELLCVCRGAGCIFIEMLQGAPAFPGVADVFEQLVKIWRVSLNSVYLAVGLNQGKNNN